MDIVQIIRHRNKTSSSKSSASSIIVRARPSDAAALSRIAYQAKKSWNYPKEWMSQWKELLTLTSQFIKSNQTYVAIIAGRKVGFYGLCFDHTRTARLDHLWVKPRFMGRGIGRSLFLHAVRNAKDHGKTRIEIESDPNAESFYAKMGARTISLVKRNVLDAERQVPLMRYAIPIRLQIQCKRV